eukprot:386266_1
MGCCQATTNYEYERIHQSDLNQSIKEHQQMMNEAKIESDLEIFEKRHNTMYGCNKDKYDKNPIITCDALKRIHQSLLYYDKLDIINNQKHQQLFEYFINEIYYQIIDDFIHLNNQHCHQLQQINESLEECTITECQYTMRHHEVDDNAANNDGNNNTLNHTLNFYKQTMDSLHFYLHHCFHVGLRTKTDANTDETDEKHEKQNIEYFDAAFSRINKMILERQHITKQFDRFSTKKK